MGSTTRVEAPPPPVINFPEPPPPRNYGQETRDTLQAQIDLAPQLYNAERTYGPKYAMLQADIYKDVMAGTGGILDFMRDQVAPTQDAITATSNRYSRASDVADIEALGGRARDAILETLEPGQRRLLDMLGQQAEEELAARGDLAPDEERAAEQAARRGWEDRGLVRSTGAVLDEMKYNNAMREDRKSRSRQFAGDVLRYKQAMLVDPFMTTVLGRQSSAPHLMATTGAAGNQFMGAGPGMFNPESAYAGQMYGQNYGGALDVWGTRAASEQDRAMTMYNAQAAANIATANNRSGLLGAGIGALGAIGGGWLGGS